ncbi:MAG: hypothetical protein AAFV26_08270, partial [Pseudomonadota bacterium]
SAELADLIAKLDARVRHIAFFGAGLSIAANMAAAQFTGWNIPGVGEPGQRKRPRTRIYATDDPNTLSQVAETIDYRNTAFVFVSDGGDRDIVHAQFDRMWPAVRDALGADAPHHLASISAIAGAAVDATLIEKTHAAGGAVARVSDTSGPLSPHQAVVGLTRGLSLADLQSGAVSFLAAADEAAAGSATVPVLTAPASGPRAVIAARDRLGMFASWVAANANASDCAQPAFAPSIRSGLAKSLRVHANARSVDVIDVEAGDRPAAELTRADSDDASVRSVRLGGFTSAALGAAYALFLLDERLAAVGERASSAGSS